MGKFFALVALVALVVGCIWSYKVISRRRRDKHLMRHDPVALTAYGLDRIAAERLAAAYEVRNADLRALEALAQRLKDVEGDELSALMSSQAREGLADCIELVDKRIEAHRKILE